MTKRKNYDTVTTATTVVVSDIFQQSTAQLLLPSPPPSLPPPKQLKKKKPKTIKIEKEILEEVVVSADTNDVAASVRRSVNVETTNSSDTLLNTAPIVNVQKKKKKLLRRVDFAAEDDFALLGTPLLVDTNTTLSNAIILQSNNDASTKTATLVAASKNSKIFEDIRPTTIRLTERGGYLHTKQSRMKISQANQGKSPWNKGKERTITAKAKISAGVRARNDEILQHKLKVLNITEEVWFQKKRQIKLLRERVRKAKIAAKQHLEQRELREQQQQQQQMKMENAEEEVTQHNSNTDQEEANTDYCATDSVVPIADDSAIDDTIKVSIENEISNKDGRSEIVVPDIHEVEQPQEEDNGNDPRTSHRFRNISLFQRDIEWTSHPFDNGKRYDTLCPSNGPGGLICCQYCMELYTKYMTHTIQDVQRHTIIKIGNEVDELYNYIRDTKQQLTQTMKVTRRKPIPIRQPQPPSSANTKTKTTTSTTTTTAITKVTNNITSKDHAKTVNHDTERTKIVSNLEPEKATNVEATLLQHNNNDDDDVVPFSERVLLLVEPTAVSEYNTTDESKIISHELLNPDSQHFLDDDNDMIESDIYEI